MENKKTIKVLLANPSVRESIDKKKERYFIKAGSRWPWSYIKNKNGKNTCCFFPFFLAYAAGVLRENQHHVMIIDGVAMDLSEDEFCSKVVKYAPDLLVIEIATHAVCHDIALCVRLKTILPKMKILFCGAHATVFARQILEENECIDFIALGEYEYTVSALADRLADQKNDFRIDGLAYRQGQDIRVSEKKGFVGDLNMLPSPAFDLFPCNDQPDLSIYRDGITTFKPAVTLHSSRGCPFQCDFCMWNQVMYGNGPYRVFSPKRVVDEMEHVIDNYAAKEIYFDDDDFCVDKKHVLGICEEIKRRGLKIKWSCMGDAIACDEDMIREMAYAGCIFMKFGVESGSRDILKNIGKPLNPEKAVEIARLCRKYGIMTHATFSFGLDGESRLTMRQTLRLANRIKFDTAQVSITTPFPGTRYYEKLERKGLLKRMAWDSFDGTMTCAFETPTLSSSEVEAFRKKAIRSIVLHKILDPVWLNNFLKRNYLLLKNHGVKTVLEPIFALFGL